ncbi:MAG: hypothetical protein P4M15_03510 [Alphaproteobacteria bacterium]|nr:hypothetical protein [Alphaproteobacteria bacterium]
MKLGRGLWLLMPLCLWGQPACAELPAFILDKDYNACIADGTDTARNTYCACVRDGMRNWGVDEYLAMVAEASQAATPDKVPVPARLMTLAQSCLPAH